MRILHLKKLYRNKILFFANVVYFIALFYWLLVREDGYYIYFQGGIYNMMIALPYIFLFMLFMSYEVFFQLNKTNTMELMGEKRISIKLQKYDLEIMTFILLISGIIIYISLYTHAMSIGYGTENVQQYFLKLVLSFVFLPGFVAVLLGWCVSTIKNRTLAICTLLCMFYLFDTSFHQLIIGIDFYNESLFKAATLFTLFDTDTVGAITDSVYQMSVEGIHFFRSAFWIFLTLFLIFLAGKKRIRAILFALTTILFLLLFWQPSGASYGLQVLNGFDRWYGDQFYYTEEKNQEMEEKLVNAKSEPFRVQNYNLDISVMEDILSVTAKLKISPGDLEEYHFTLYHRYKIHKILDQNGKKLRFMQDGDYVTVYNEVSGIREMTIDYSGFNQYFYATTQAICLPANYEYYPIAGWHKAFIRDENNICFTQELPEEDSCFNVQVACPISMNLYTNLNEIETKIWKHKKIIKYQGKAEGLTMLGSVWIRSMQIGNKRVVYSCLDQEYSPELRETKEMYEEFFEKYEFPENTTFFAMPQGNYSNVCFGKNQIVDQIFKAQEDYGVFLQKGNNYYDLEEDDDDMQEAIDMLNEENRSD